MTMSDLNKRVKYTGAFTCTEFREGTVYAALMNFDIDQCNTTFALCNGLWFAAAEGGWGTAGSHSTGGEASVRAHEPGARVPFRSWRRVPCFRSNACQAPL